MVRLVGIARHQLGEPVLGRIVDGCVLQHAIGEVDVMARAGIVARFWISAWRLFAGLKLDRVSEGTLSLFESTQGVPRNLRTVCKLSLKSSLKLSSYYCMYARTDTFPFELSGM